ncbi:MAG: ABC transporter ATP-binding protein/permease [Kiritimatiellae bacterium]|nr:ABC transporter ATP-binding protein/permease [Kiritimatiellia bacterium]
MATDAGSRHRLWAYVRPHRALVAASGVCVLAAVAAQVAAPAVLRRIVDELAAGRVDRSSLSRSLALFLGVSAAGAGCALLMRRWPLRIGYEVERDLRRDLLQHLTRLEPAFYRDARTGDLMTRLTSDVATVRELVGQGILQGARSVTVVVVAFAAMIATSPVLAAVMAALFPPLILIFFVMLGRIRRRHEEVQRLQGELCNFCQESLAGIRTIRALAVEGERQRRWSELSQELVRGNLRLGWVQNPLWPLFGFSFAVGSLALLLVGGRMMLDGRLTLGALVQFQQYLLFMQWPMLAIGWTASLVQRGRASWDRICEVLERRPAVADGPYTDPLAPSPEGDIEFDQVSVIEGGRRLLDDITLRIPAGTVVGITGPTGAGKSLLVSLLPRARDPTAGTVRIGGRDLRQYPLAVLRGALGVVPQEPVLFSDTLAGNLSFGLDRPDEAWIRAAAELAHLHDDALALPQQYSTLVGERGVTLSGGQRRRAALGRALARRPRYLVLDDPFAAVDAATEAAILQRLRPVFAGCTAIVISHRVSTLREADRIVVLEGGRVTATGTHQELLACCAYYRDLVRRQDIERGLEAAS